MEIHHSSHAELRVCALAHFSLALCKVSDCYSGRKCPKKLRQVLSMIVFLSSVLVTLWKVHVLSPCMLHISFQSTEIVCEHGKIRPRAM